MKVDYDKEADAMYMKYTSNRIISTKESWDSLVDYDINWNVVWIEIIWVKSLFQNNNIQIKEFSKKESEYL